MSELYVVMKVRLILLNLLIIKVSCSVGNDFLLDYFAYKQAPKVIGFTCNEIIEDLELIKSFSKAGITATFGQINDAYLINQLLNTYYYKIGVYVDIRCNDGTDYYYVFDQAAAYRRYDELHHWLVASDDLTSATDLIADDTFGLATDLVVATPANTSEVEGYDLFDVYNSFKLRGGKLNVTYFGSWNSSSGLRVSLSQNKYDRRSNLHGMPLKVSFFGIKYRAPRVSLEEHLQDLERTGTKDGLSKFGFSIIKPITELFNFTMILNEYGKWKRNDRMGPLTKALQFNEIDISGTPISVLADKVDIVAFVYTAWPFRTCFLFRSPQTKAIKVREVLRPLEDDVWYLLGAISIVFVLMLAVNFQFDHVESSSVVHYSNSFIITIGCLCQQGTNIQMNRISTRIVFLSIMVFGLIIYNYYSASVVSARLNEPIIKVNDSMISLALTTLKVASEPMLYFDFFMKENEQQTELFNRTKWQKLTENDRYILPEKGVQLVKRGGFAYHAHPEVAYPYINRLFDNREICELTEVHLAKPSYRSVAVPLNSSFIEISRRGFTKLTEVGIRSRQLRRWKARPPSCRRDILSVSSTNMYEFAPHLILLVLGMMLAVILFTIEIMYFNYKETKGYQEKDKHKYTQKVKFDFYVHRFSKTLFERNVKII